MSSSEYQQLSNKMDKLADKFDREMLPRPEYEKSHTALEYRVQAIEHKLEAWSIAGRAEVEKIEIAAGTRYDKLGDKLERLNTKLDGLKDNIELRFTNQQTQKATEQRGNFQWIVSLISGLVGGGGISSLLFYLAHFTRP